MRLEIFALCWAESKYCRSYYITVRWPSNRENTERLLSCGNLSPTVVRHGNQQTLQQVWLEPPHFLEDSCRANDRGNTYHPASGWRAGRWQRSTTTPQESVWKVWCSEVWYNLTFGSSDFRPRSATWPSTWPSLFCKREASNRVRKKLHSFTVPKIVQGCASRKETSSKKNIILAKLIDLWIQGR